MNLILGTANFCNDYGKRLERDECLKILDRAYELGVWGIDTAVSYGDSSKVVQEWHDNNPYKDMVTFSKAKLSEPMPSGTVHYRLGHSTFCSMDWRGYDGLSVYTTHWADKALESGWLQAPFSPLNTEFKKYASHERFIARSIFCGGKLQRSHPEDVARLVFGFLKSHEVKNAVFGVESIEELELIVRVANEK